MSPSQHPEILPTHTPALFEAAVGRAAALLRAGEIVALPTETVYGLAANAFDASAVARIFEAKGRPAHNPIIVHVAGVELARQCVAEWPAPAGELARAFWPGPLTLVLPKAAAMPGIVTAGGSTVGVRWPAHPFIQAVIRACGFPLAAPSANRSNRLSPTNAAHVAKDLGDRVALIVDGGQCQVGVESTVLDIAGQVPRLLRPGMIHASALAAVLGETVSIGGDSPGEALRSPGRLPKHYAPRTRLLVLAWNSDGDLRQLIATRRLAPERAFVIAHTHIPSPAGFGGVSVIPHDAEAYARALYAELHRCDEQGAGVIVVEAVPDQAEWAAVADRLRRATA